MRFAEECIQHGENDAHHFGLKEVGGVEAADTADRELGLVFDGSCLHQRKRLDALRLRLR